MIMFWQRHFQSITFRIVLLTVCLLPAALFGQLRQYDNSATHSSVHIASSRSLPQYVMKKKCVQESLCFYTADGNNQFQSQNRLDFYQSFNPDIPICIFVHGAYTNWKDVCLDTASVKQWLQAASPGKPMQLIYYTWSSQMSASTLLPQLDTNVLGCKSAFNGLYLAQMIAKLPGNANITLVGHSFGCRTITSTLHLLGGGKVQGYQLQGTRVQAAGGCQHRMRAVFTAAPLDHDWLNLDGRYNKTLQRAEHIVNLKNRQDWALALYPYRRPFSRTALGRNGWTKKDYQEMGRLKCKVSEYDITCQIGTNHGWPHYARRHDIARFLGNYIYFAEAEQRRLPAEQHILQQSHRTPSTPTPVRETYRTLRRLR